MTHDESRLAVTYVKTAWRREPMTDMESRQLRRLFLDHPPELVRSTIDALIDLGDSRPSAAELEGMLRVKSGKAAPGGRTQRPGPFHGRGRVRRRYPKISPSACKTCERTSRKGQNERRRPAHFLSCGTICEDS